MKYPKINYTIYAIIISVSALYLMLKIVPDIWLRDKYIYSDMGTIIEKKQDLTLFAPYESAGGYLFYVIPTRTSGHALRA